MEHRIKVLVVFILITINAYSQFTLPNNWKTYQTGGGPMSGWVGFPSITSGTYSYNSDVTHYKMATSFEYNGDTHLAIGEESGKLFTYYWDEAILSWEEDNYTGAGDIGSFSVVTIIELSGTIYAIVGGTNGQFDAYTLSGTTWSSNTSILSGLPSDLGSYSSPMSFFDGSNLYMVAGEGSSSWNGWQWGGSSWSNHYPTISNLTSGAFSRITMFNHNGYIYAITSTLTAPSVLRGYEWTGSEWQSNPVAINGISGGDYLSPGAIVLNGEIYLLVGTPSSGFIGYKLY